MSRKNYEVLIGQKFERLTVLEIIKVKNSHTKARCVCDCGNEITTQVQYLLTGHTKSCGCYREEHCHKLGAKTIKHGFVGHPLYFVHQSMIARCERSTHPAYHNYGGRGIRVCDEWHDMAVFGKWALENGYVAGKQLDRIDNNGNYEPSNCRWVTPKENSRNRRNTVYLTLNGETKCVSEWCETLEISPNTIYWWVKKLGRKYAEQRIERMLKNAS